MAKYLIQDIIPPERRQPQHRRNEAEESHEPRSLDHQVRIPHAGEKRPVRIQPTHHHTEVKTESQHAHRPIEATQEDYRANELEESKVIDTGIAHTKYFDDKNISPGQKTLQKLIADHVKKYPVGIHPSWQSGDDPSLLKKEMDSLQAITGNRVLSSRQHYIRFTLPETYRGLIENGIQSDYSLGYGSINGFRASVASPFFWYDLKKELQTELTLYPFCYMETNSFYEQRLAPQQALE